MNKEKQHLIELLNKIDNTKKELKQLNKEYKTAFVAIVNHGSDQLTSSTLKVYAGNLSQSVSSLQIIGQSQVQTGEMKAGEEAVLSLQGKDAQEVEVLVDNFQLNSLQLIPRI